MAATTEAAVTTEAMVTTIADTTGAVLTALL
jgi:hypothetical protein